MVSKRKSERMGNGGGKYQTSGEPQNGAKHIEPEKW